MGGLIPNGNDAEVIDQLNARFRGAKLTKLRKHIHDNADDFFASSRRLHRISHRLKIFPTSGTRPKGRWYVFLRDLLGDANRLKILEALRDNVGNDKCVGIRFWAQFNTATSPPDYDVEVVQDTPDANGNFWVTITLLCDHEIDPSLPGDPSTPRPDSGEQGPVHPNLTPAKPKTLKSVKKSTKKAKKKVKKAAKKKEIRRGRAIEQKRVRKTVSAASAADTIGACAQKAAASYARQHGIDMHMGL